MMIGEAVSRVRAKVLPTIWQRRWAVVWNAGAELRSDADWLAFHLPRLGFEVVCVKVCDGGHAFTGSHGLNLSQEWLAPLRKAGLRLTGWGYSYGYDPGAEAVKALELSHDLGLTAFVCDAEAEYEYDPVDSPSAGAGRQRYSASQRWLHVWGSAKRRPPLGVTSFGRVDLHRLDWAAWHRAGARFVPQAYANESGELEVARCVRAAGVYWDRRFVHPWVGCYTANGGRVSGEQYAAQLHAAGTRGFGVYLADTASIDDLRALGKAR